MELGDNLGFYPGGIDEASEFKELTEHKKNVKPDEATQKLLYDRFVETILQNNYDKQSLVLKEKLEASIKIRNNMHETILSLQSENELLKENISLYNSQSEHSLKLLRGRQLEQAKTTIEQLK